MLAILLAAVALLPLSSPATQGAPVLLEVKSDVRLDSLSAEWLGKRFRLHWHQAKQVWWALAGVDLEAPLGTSTIQFSDGSKANVEIVAGQYRSSKLTVPPKFISPPPEVKERIEKEQAIKKRVFGAAHPERWWQGEFLRPATQPTTAPFGSRRIYNGQKKSVHLGLDFGTPTGTPIKAVNAGRVVIAQQFYYEGGLVVIDHGEGWFSVYMHLSEFVAKEGQQVKQGEVVAKSGGTGQSTGPHLHWGMRWQGIYVDPAVLLRLKIPGGG
jgi:murein DD-endopeptidase MepM/ murein hydrolase activator NlpD